MTRWVLVVALVVGGCAMETTRFVAPVLPRPGDADFGQVRRDERDCAAYAIERPSETRYATYVSCMVSRGHRTYASLVARNGATGVTLLAESRKAAPEIYRNLEECARVARVRVDMPPHADTFSGAPAQTLTMTSQKPFADCMNGAGYATTLHATPDSIAMATRPTPTPPGPVIGGTTSVITPVPTPAPPTSRTSPAVPAPAPPVAAPPPTATPRSTTAVTPSPAVTRPPRPVKLGLFLEPGSKPPVVSIVTSDTPAGRAGVRPGDVVLRIDGKSIGSEDDIAAALATKAPDDIVRIDLQRGNQQVVVDAILVAP